MAIGLHGSITEEEKTFIETWENVGPGTYYVIQENRRGDEVYVPITGRRNFRISTYERMITEDKSLDPRNNPFKNGAFRPITTPDGISIDTNPNALSDDDIRRLFRASEVAWEEYMVVIDSPATLTRMIELAEADEAMPLKRFRQLEQRREKYTNIGKRVQHKDPEIQKQIDSMAGGETARRGAGGPMRATTSTSSTSNPS